MGGDHDVVLGEALHRHGLGGAVVDADVAERLAVRLVHDLRLPLEEARQRRNDQVALWLRQRQDWVRQHQRQGSDGLSAAHVVGEDAALDFRVFLADHPGEGDALVLHQLHAHAHRRRRLLHQHSRLEPSRHSHVRCRRAQAVLCCRRGAQRPRAQECLCPVGRRDGHRGGVGGHGQGVHQRHLAGRRVAVHRHAAARAAHGPAWRHRLVGEVLLLLVTQVEREVEVVVVVVIETDDVLRWPRLRSRGGVHDRHRARDGLGARARHLPDGRALV
mmetsp:Transcript_13876/g.54815  ORF Transcript_13876/g.54815 Transcript_13876/m.54815 type:complete len:274 (-) Transcript_13876:549-1370(-)